MLLAPTSQSHQSPPLRGVSRPLVASKVQSLGVVGVVFRSSVAYKVQGPVVCVAFFDRQLLLQLSKFVVWRGVVSSVSTLYI